MRLFVSSLCIYSGIASSYGIEKRKLIVAGAETPIGEHPYTVSISTRDPHTSVVHHVCTGTLIRNDVVLTAAHCIHDLSLDNTIVIVGCDNYLSATIDQMYGVASVSHAGFTYKGFAAQNDIALVFLNRCADRIGFFPILSADQIQADKMCSTIEAVGFGRSEQIPPFLFVPDGKLRRVNSSQVIHSHVTCKEAFLNYTLKTKFKSKFISAVNRKLLDISIPETVGCYGGESSAISKGYPCEGDSGGAVLLRESHTVVGITSFSSETCGTLPNYFTRVSMYTDWIRGELVRRARRSVCAVNRPLEEVFATGASAAAERQLLDAQDSPSHATESETEGVVEDLSLVVHSSCQSEHSALNNTLAQPLLSMGEVRESCLPFLRCIESSSGQSPVDITNKILRLIGSSIDSMKAESNAGRRVAGRLLLCTSRFELHYDTLVDEAAVNASYMDEIPAKAECLPTGA